MIKNKQIPEQDLIAKNAKAPVLDQTRIIPQKFLWARMLKRFRIPGFEIIGYLQPRNGPERVDSVAFSISFIALAAKLAKADGQVTADEVAMFRRVFTISREDEKRAAQVFDLCRQDIAGYEVHARKLTRILGTGNNADAIRLNVLDGLFHIAMVDDEFHPGEEAFLETVAGILQISASDYKAMMARHVPNRADPFAVLGVDSQASPEKLPELLRQARRRIALECHPDKLPASGLPTEMIALATERMAAANRACDEALALCETRFKTMEPLSCNP